MFWIPRDSLSQHQLSIDMEDMVRIFESDNLSEFYYYLENSNWKHKLL